MRSRRTLHAIKIIPRIRIDGDIELADIAKSGRRHDVPCATDPMLKERLAVFGDILIGSGRITDRPAFDGRRASNASEHIVFKTLLINGRRRYGGGGNDCPGCAIPLFYYCSVALVVLVETDGPAL